MILIGLVASCMSCCMFICSINNNKEQYDCLRNAALFIIAAAICFK